MGRVAYLFPGQGSQEPGMAGALADAYPECAEVLARADDALGFALSTLMREGPRDTLGLTEHTQPAILTASVAALRAAQSFGLPAPDFVAGHSLGEYSALVCAGVLSLEDAVRAVRLRGRFMQEAVPVGDGAMAAILGLGPEGVAEACREAEAELPGRVVVPANFNGPGQTVIAGHVDAVEVAIARCRERKARRALPLPVSAPFHSPLMAPVRPRLAEVLDAIPFGDARVPLVTNVEAAPEDDGARLRALLLEQVTAAVRWTEVVDRLVAEGCDTFIELGHGNALTGLVKRQVPGARLFSVGDPGQLEAAGTALAA